MGTEPPPEGTIQVKITPRPAFRPYLMRKERYAVLVCHRRAGKSFGCVQDLGAKAFTCTREHLIESRRNLRNAPLRYAYVAPTRDQAKDVAWGYMKEFFSKIPGVKLHESELRVTLPNRAQIRLYSGENYERMRGLYFDGIILDEYADIDPNAWATVIRPCLSDYKGWVTFIGTPKGKNAFYDVWKSGLENPKWFTLMLKASESGILDEEEIQDIKDDPLISHNQYLQEYECDFTIASPGAIFLDDMEQARKEGRISPNVLHHEGIPVYTAFDVGAPPNTKCWIFQVVGDKVNLLQALTGANKVLDTPAKWANLLGNLSRERNYSYGCHFLPHDGKTVWYPVFQEAGLTNVDALDRSKSLWDPINQAKRSFPRVHINEDECDQGIHALEQWSTRTVAKKEYTTNEPNHDWCSHWGTAFSYVFLAIQQGKCVNRAGQTKKGRRSSGIRSRRSSGRGNSKKRR